jgi:hypothetical protein
MMTSIEFLEQLHGSVCSYGILNIHDENYEFALEKSVTHQTEILWDRSQQAIKKKFWVRGQGGAWRLTAGTDVRVKRHVPAFERGLWEVETPFVKKGRDCVSGYPQCCKSMQHWGYPNRAIQAA